MSNTKTVTFPNGDSVTVPVFSAIKIGQTFTTESGRTVRYHNVARRDADTHIVGYERDGRPIEFINDYEFLEVVA